MICDGAAWLEEAARLHREGRPFVLATVVARQAPQSARPGAKAVVLPDGALEGWIGGGCVRPTVVREALAALRDGRPRLLRINPGAEPDPRDDVRVFTMTCEGEGAVDVYLEPVVPRAELMILGRTPVAEALARLAEPLGLAVRVADPLASAAAFPSAAELLADLSAVPARLGPRTFVVVATMGEGDHEALAAALSGEAAYVGLVASRRKGSALLSHFPEHAGRVKYPAGLDLGAATPAEIALSVLAEIVRLQRSGAAPPGTVAVPALAAAPPGEVTATDPVCGMAVEIRASRITLEHEGRTYHFCCPHCRRHFERDPARYLAAGVAGD